MMLLGDDGIVLVLLGMVTACMDLISVQTPASSTSHITFHMSTCSFPGTPGGFFEVNLMRVNVLYINICINIYT